MGQRHADTEADKVPGARGGLPDSVAIVGLSLIVGSVVWQAAKPIREDVWWHIRLGLDFWEGRSLSRPGQFGAFSVDSWVPTQWLTQMAMSKSYEMFGLDGISWLFGAALATLVVVLYLASRNVGGTLAAALATGVAVIGMSASLSPRPHMVTYIFVAATLGAWLKAAAHGKNPWWLVPLTWIWACAHGMWFIGPVTGLVLTLGARLDKSGRIRTNAIWIPLLSALVALATPVGPRLITAPFAVSGVSRLISEWQPPDFRSVGPATTALMILVVIFSWSREGREASWVEIGILAQALGWTVLAARTVAIGAIFAAVLFASVLQRWISRPNKRPSPSETVSVWASSAAWLAILVLLLTTTTNRPENVPTSLGTHLERIPAGSVVFVPDTLGGWIMWEYPHLLPVVDGLTESYSLEYWSGLLGAASAAPGWKAFIERTDSRVAVLPSRFPLVDALTDRLQWIKVAQEGDFVLLEHPNLSAD